QLGLVVYNAAEDHFELIGLSGSPAVAPTYTVATLPEEGVRGQMVFVRDGRKAGESEGNGTGVLCYWDGSAWVTCDAGAAVEASRTSTGPSTISSRLILGRASKSSCPLPSLGSSS